MFDFIRLQVPGLHDRPGDAHDLDVGEASPADGDGSSLDTGGLDYESESAAIK